VNPQIFAQSPIQPPYDQPHLALRFYLYTFNNSISNNENIKICEKHIYLSAIEYNLIKRKKNSGIIKTLQRVISDIEMFYKPFASMIHTDE
jgi:hypothetical protein